jgi:endoglucanase
MQHGSSGGSHTAAGLGSEDRIFRIVETRCWAVLAAISLVGLATECGGPEGFRPHSGAGGQGGSAVAGVAGSSGPGAGGAAGSGDAGPTDAEGDTSMAGAGVATDAAGAAGAGGVAGVAGTGAAGTTGGASVAGAGGMAGGAGMSGAGGAKDAGAYADAGAHADAGGYADAGPDVPPPLFTVQYECRQNGSMVTLAEYSIKVVNTGSTGLSLANVSVRYWYTIDGTGPQAGSCVSTAHPCTIVFQKTTTAKPTADQYAVISFAGGTLAPGADTGEIQIQMHGSGTYDQTNDYSFDDTGAVFIDETRITGYLSGKLAWGSAP